MTQETHENRLRVLRAEQRITQLRLAARTRINPTRIWRIENAVVTATDEEKARIALALGVTVPAVWPDVSPSA